MPSSLRRSELGGRRTASLRAARAAHGTWSTALAHSGFHSESTEMASGLRRWCFKCPGEATDQARMERSTCRDRQGRRPNRRRRSSSARDANLLLPGPGSACATELAGGSLGLSARQCAPAPCLASARCWCLCLSSSSTGLSTPGSTRGSNRQATSSHGL